MMTKRMAAIVPTALVAASILLTACGQDGPATGSTQVTPSGSAPATSTPRQTTTTASPVERPRLSGGQTGTKSGDKDTLKPVECGPVKLDSGIVHMLVAEPTPAGLVGCTEAFNVIDEYLKLPAGQRDHLDRNTKLSRGWECGTDDGEHAVIGCTSGRDNGKGGKPGGFALHTKPVSK